DPPNPRHYTGFYDGSPVLVEQKTVPVSASHNLLEPRIEKIVHLLKASQNIKELRTLPCIGYVYTQPGEGSLDIDADYCRYEFIYTIHAGPILSLHDMLKDMERRKGARRRELSLDKRFDIARTLSRALLYLHAAEWLHKGIRSSNIMFVPSNQPNNGQSGSPYLVGFEYSRVSSHDEGTENQETTSEDNLYRHPERQGLPAADNEPYIGKTGRFTKDHDIYSLGVTLIEMGLLRSAEYISKRWGEGSFKDFLIKTAIPQVTFNMGVTYAEAALHCLESNFYSQPGTSNGDGSVAFYKKVVSQLELCRA
ncbi:hypothetical protein AbraIFM66951_009662, partial [Aspergillus brasiliensis]